jgi:hypothetical protein
MIIAEKPLCAPIDRLRDALYDESREFVRGSNSVFEAIVKSVVVGAAIEIDLAVLRVAAGRQQR